MKQRRPRIKHKATFEERLAEETIRFKEAAKDHPPGSHAREMLLRYARQAETASHINNWLTSPTAAEGRGKFAYRAEEVGLERCRNTAPNVIGPDGHIQQRIDLLCADDNAAEERTKQLADGHAIDLWHGDRFIATFKAEQQKNKV